jgi:phosphatidylserine/phosphatidylglycerophosphate/cardiolipin synthase-like enzyme
MGLTSIAMQIVWLLFLLLLPVGVLAKPVTEEAFSPHQGATELVVKTINEAQASVRVAAYSFTSRPIAQALIDACNRGADVRVVFDKSQRTNGFLVRSFADSCVQSRINSRYAIMHDKFMIMDDTVLELGSFNYTKAAENKNAENVLVLRDDPQAVRSYMQQWEKLWDEADEGASK